MSKPDSCEWYGEDSDKTCNREPSEELYEYNEETDDELWVCEGHFTSSMYETPPAEMNGKWVMSGDVAEKLDELIEGGEIVDEVEMARFLRKLKEPADKIFDG